MAMGINIPVIALISMMKQDFDSNISKENK